MSTEAMKLALDHLINLQPILGNGLFEERQLAFIDPHIDCAITALREALAEPQQEPVAWMSDHAVGFKKSEFGATPTVPLYTSPPAQRKPLTDEEVETVWRSVQANDFHDCVKPFARAIEAKHNIKEST